MKCNSKGIEKEKGRRTESKYQQLEIIIGRRKQEERNCIPAMFN
jgi:hypothetical protein